MDAGSAALALKGIYKNRKNMMKVEKIPAFAGNSYKPNIMGYWD